MRAKKRSDRHMISLYLERSLASAIREAAAYDRISLQDLGETLFELYVANCLTADPDLVLLVDGVRVTPAVINGRVYHFTISKNCEEVLIVSRTVVPAEINNSQNDRRTLGVPIQHIVLREGDKVVKISYDSLFEGFHGIEEGFRWTNGRARLPKESLCSFESQINVEISLEGSSQNYALRPRRFHC
jgi:hypothetical protein